MPQISFFLKYRMRILHAQSFFVCLFVVLYILFIYVSDMCGQKIVVKNYYKFCCFHYFQRKNLNNRSLMKIDGVLRKFYPQI